MSLSAITFWIDYEKRRLIESFTSTAAAATPTFTQGDTIPVEVHLVRQKGSIREEIGFPAGSTLKIGIGRLESLPTSGSFILGYKTDSTSPLAWNASASDIQTALNALASVTAEGGIEVSQAGDAFLILWNTGTNHDPFSGDPDELFPPSNISLASQVLGDSQRTLLHLQQSPIAYLDDFDSMDAPEASMTLVSTSGTKKVYRLEIDPAPAGGTFVISSTVGATTQDSNAISVDALASNVQSLLPANALAGASVIKSGSYSWDISVALNVSLAVDDSGLMPWLGKQGRITLATAEVHQFLAGASSGNAFMEILLEEAEGETTLIQTPCRIQADMIDEGLINPVPLSPPFAEATANLRYVRRDTDQNPDAATQDQIWENLGVSLDGSDVVAAINASSSPSSGNPFVTASEVNGFVSGFAPINSPTFTGTVIIPSGASISGYLTEADASSTYLSQSSASSLYLTQSSASSTYLTQANAGSTYLSLTSAASTYLSQSNAASTYLTQANAGSTYLSLTSAASTYLSQSNAASIYAPKADPTFSGTISISGSISGTQTNSAILNQTLTFSQQDNSLAWFSSFGVQPGNIGSVNADLNLSWGHRSTWYKSYGAATKSIEIEPQAIYFDGVSNNNRLYFSNGSLISTNKISGTSVAGKAGVNIGIGGTSTDATTPGDLWITTGGASLNFRDGTGAWRQLLSSSSAGQITTTSTAPAFQITQNGTGAAFQINNNGSGRTLIVQDGSSNPDTSAMIIDADGRVGIGVSNSATTPWDGASFGTNNILQIKGDVRLILKDGGVDPILNSPKMTNDGSNIWYFGGRLPNSSGAGSQITDHYPYEIVFWLNSVAHYIPCRF